MQILALTLMMLMFSSSALALRVLLRNPDPQIVMSSHQQKKIQLIKKFHLNRNTYYVIHLPVRRDQVRSLAQFFNAQASFEDLPIRPVFTMPPKHSNSQAGWHLKELDYAQFYNHGAQGQGVIVAVLDTGVDFTHSALASQMWVNRKEIPNNKIDDDNNGYVDDVHGYNFVADGGPIVPGDGTHGTHCAGIVAALPHQNKLGMGVAPRAKIMNVKILENKDTFISDAVEGITYAVNHGARILTNSWRTYGSWGYHTVEGKKLLKEAIQYAGSKNAIFVAAAGNETYNNDLYLQGTADEIIPAGFVGLENLVVIGSSAPLGTMSYFSNFGKMSVAIAAPGSDIFSTTPNNKWEIMSGTSMATPLIAGVLARGLSAGMSAPMAIHRLKVTADKAPDWEGKTQSGGVVNIVNFLKWDHRYR